MLVSIVFQYMFACDVKDIFYVWAKRYRTKLHPLKKIFLLSHNSIKDSYFTYAFVMMSATGKKLRKNLRVPQNHERYVK